MCVFSTFFFFFFLPFSKVILIATSVILMCYFLLLIVRCLNIILWELNNGMMKNFVCMKQGFHD